MTEPAYLPLLSARDLDAPLAWHKGQPISARQFLADVQRQSLLLPDAGPVINVCANRYSFAVSLAAAMQRGQHSLLPPDARPDTLRRVAAGHARAYVLADDTRIPADVHVCPEPGSTAADGGAAPAGMPLISAAQSVLSLLTSGSTGTPQPHAKMWGTLTGDVQAAVPRLCQLLGRESLVGLNLVATVPVQHSYGLESSALLALLGGASFDTGRPFYPADIVQSLESVPRPRALITTPFHLKTLLQSGVRIPPVDLLLSATAPLSPQLAAQAEEATGGVLLEIYGSTETGQVAWRQTTAGEVWETFGTLRVRPQRTDERAPGETTERYMFEGDFLPAPTPMSDVLVLLDDRRFRLLGRSNDLIHVAGRRSSLGNLNFHLNSIPGVLDGAIWIPDEVADGVVRPIAFVVAPELSAAQVLAGLRERVENVFVPRRVVKVDALPREGTGKLTAGALREFALARLNPGGAPTDTPRTPPDAEKAAAELSAAPGSGAASSRRSGEEGPWVFSYAVSPGHPCFAGHFPGQPLLPGAWLLSLLMEQMQSNTVLSERLGAEPQLASAKFLAPVRPGAQLRTVLQAEAAPGRGIRFELWCSESAASARSQLAVSGRWVPGAA